MEKYNKKYLEENLPDYIFGRLSPEESNLYSESVRNYPDLLDEIKEAKAVFAKINAMELKAESNLRSLKIVNLVSERLESKRQKRFLFLAKYLAPTIGVACVFAFMYFKKPAPVDYSNFSTARNPIEQEYTILSPQEVFQNLGDTISIEDIEAVECDMNQIISEDDSSKKLFEELFAENLDRYVKVENLESMAETTPAYDPYTVLNNVSEDDFQSILKEMNNEDYK